MAKFFCIESPFVDYCFLEPVERLENGVRSRVRMRPELTNSWGGAHGGLTVTLLDASMSVSARYALDPEGKIGVATIDMSTSFIGQAREVLECEARVVNLQGSILFLEAEARNESGALVARAIGTFKALRG